MASVERCLRQNIEVVERLRGEILLGYTEAIEVAGAVCIQQAISLSSKRIYQKPVPKLKNGKPKYVRTGVYKASFYTKPLPDNKGFIFKSPVVYSTHLEYRCGYNIVKDAVLSQREIMARMILNKVMSRIK